MTDARGEESLGTLDGGRWVLTRTLGTGASASVYQATDTMLGVERAIKLLHPQGGGATTGRARLMGEARAMALLNHPHVLKIYDVGQDGEREYVVMDLATGGNLANLIEQGGPLAETVALRYGLQLLSALAAAHAHGIVHRDVKPHNVLLDEQGIARLADFGIALHLNEDGMRATRTGTALGTLAFMAPEQRIDARRVGAQADLYAVGTTLFYLITGDNPVDLFAAVEDAARWRGLSEPVRQILSRATRYRPEERYATAAEMARDIVRALESDDRVQSDPLDPRTFPEPSTRLTHDRDRVVAAPTVEWETATDDAITFLLERDLTAEPLIVPALSPPPRRRRWPFVLAATPLFVVLGVWLGVTLRGEAPDVEGELVDVLHEDVVTSEQPVVPSSPRSEPDDVVVAATPAPRPRPTPAPPVVSAPVGPRPLGRWVGAFNGRPTVIDLAGTLSEVHGTVTVRFGESEVTTPVKGAFDVERRTLVLQDQVETVDAGRYTAVLTEDESTLEGRFEGVHTGRLAMFSMKAAP